ncbi:hypothetical protein QVD99_008681 [Batrachochytrium dendrobatidis]|uniref:Uncharacterized protein n=1 Tax=Batrachochytrium dendrobatidis (strain JEL423) TaxID=403673 RepID=A0A177WMV2_BATDL|nr:hypothetical protein QVD99_008681 [Batrachochytrium dendrobatidis]OAJ41449.1 hypothetical protein BDEG_25044 [Batrachochytrium dendrobatidis JEL423]
MSLNSLNIVGMSLCGIAIGGHLIILKRLALDLFSKNHAGRTLKQALFVLNMLSIILQLIQISIASMYSGVPLPRQDTLHIIRGILSGLSIGGVGCLQLEIRIIFSSFFNKSVQHWHFWTDANKTRIRVAVILLHLIVFWPEYIKFYTAPWIQTWEFIGVFINVTIVIVTSFSQAIIIIRKLEKHQAGPATQQPTWTRNRLATFLILTFMVNLAGVVAIFLEAIHLNTTNDPNEQIRMILDAIAISCIGFELVCESYIIVRVVDIVAHSNSDPSISANEKTISVMEFQKSQCIPVTPFQTLSVISKNHDRSNLVNYLSNYPWPTDPNKTQTTEESDQFVSTKTASI